MYIMWLVVQGRVFIVGVVRETRKKSIINRPGMMLLLLRWIIPFSWKYTLVRPQPPVRMFLRRHYYCNNYYFHFWPKIFVFLRDLVPDENKIDRNKNRGTTQIKKLFFWFFSGREMQNKIINIKHFAIHARYDALINWYLMRVCVCV